VLGEHLTRIVARCRRAGVTIVLSSYPFHAGPVHEAQASVADRLGVPFVDATARFTPDPVARQALFVADGHCSDAGYDLLAASIADVLLAQIEKR
jgi:lysophospholipase L1-like esterase